MTARSISSLTVTFGLVAIPVKLYSATSSKSIAFNLLHKGCGSRLKQQYLCAKENVVVPSDDIVKGYEFAKDQYVMFAPDELKALEEAGSRAVEITEFVPIESVDPIYFDKAYYLAPDKGGAKPYALFVQALHAAGRCALGRWASHGKQHVVMLRPFDGGLVMQQLLYAADVRAIGELEIPSVEVKAAELKLARQLIEQQSVAGFDPAAYTDAVRERIEAAVEKKVEGQEITVPEEAAGGAQIIDLMEALRLSLEKKGAAVAPLEGTRRPPKRAAAAHPAGRAAAKK
ncbi:MAG: Ku protein [Hyphomicrobiaceae bacterium]